MICDKRTIHIVDIPCYPESKAKSRVGSRQPGWEIPDVIFGHEFHGLSTQESHTIVFSAVEHHLAKPKIVRRRSNQPTGTHEIDMGLLYEPAFRRRFIKKRNFSVLATYIILQSIRK